MFNLNNKHIIKVFITKIIQFRIEIKKKYTLKHHNN